MVWCVRVGMKYVWLVAEIDNVQGPIYSLQLAGAGRLGVFWQPQKMRRVLCQ